MKTMPVYYSELHSLMQSIVHHAAQNDWEHVLQLDKTRHTLLEAMPRASDKSTSTPDEIKLKQSILNLDEQLMELSNSALKQSKDDLTQLNKRKTNCSQYVQTQKY